MKKQFYNIGVAVIVILITVNLSIVNTNRTIDTTLKAEACESLPFAEGGSGVLLMRTCLLYVPLWEPAVYGCEDGGSICYI